MGKKSREKRKRRQASSGISQHSAQSKANKSENVDSAFTRQCEQLATHFSQFSPEDVLLSLCVSDLWLPNISAQIKHQLAFSLAIGTTRGSSEGLRAIASYEDFRNFVETIKTLLPAFPVLEDYVPEPDWGDIRIAQAGNFPRIFYGGNVERIPDFIAAYRILHGSNSVALRDMDSAIALQARVIDEISREDIGELGDLSPGHLECPSEGFWVLCRELLIKAQDDFAVLERSITRKLLVDLGELPKWRTESEFGNAAMEGTALPFLFARAGDRQFPLSLRNATNVVLDFWAGREVSKEATKSLEPEKRLSDFLAQRIDRRALIPGPLKIGSRRHRIPQAFVASLTTSSKLYFIALLRPDEMATFDSVIAAARQALVDDPGWVLLPRDADQAVKIFRNGNVPISANEIEFVGVLSRASTSPLFLNSPEDGTRILALADFVTIFDSINEPNELDRFWSYIESNDNLFGGFIGHADLFASFRDSHALLVDGAIQPTMISLDPHWGSNWRFKELQKFWSIAPPKFPDDLPSWNVEEVSDGIQRITAKNNRAMAWSTSIGRCVIQAVAHFDDESLDLHNGRLLELFIHCLVDSLAQRSSLIGLLSVFERRSMTLTCRPRMGSMASETPVPTHSIENAALFDSLILLSDPQAEDIALTVEINLSRVQEQLDSPRNAKFEAECTRKVLETLLPVVGLQLDSALASEIDDTAGRKPRFTLRRVRRSFDTPDFADPLLPEPRHYKAARRDLAVVIKELGIVAPRRYELASGKTVIDQSRDAYRRRVHSRIAEFEVRTLVHFCITQLDKLTTRFHRDVFQLQQSLSHEVSFDRVDGMAGAHNDFSRYSRNYRYLLECCLSQDGHGLDRADSEGISQLIAAVDWLFVLYDASDSLHNGIDVGGLELDASFVPSVFYSQDREPREREFAREMAEMRLGIDLSEEDVATSEDELETNSDNLDAAFRHDVGFSFRNFMGTLAVLSRWNSVGGDTALRFLYEASETLILEKVMEQVVGISEEETKLIIAFSQLAPKEIRRLIGRDTIEADVPVWEHSKRSSRYTIRPLVRCENDKLIWGAGAANRALGIWTGAVTNGYLPAEFGWPLVKTEVRKIKVAIEEALEVQAFRVCARFVPFVLHGVDFFRRFPRDKFEDVGDFDVLGYWPSTNQWLSVECKYNQPPFCLKDARRLRDRIFGNADDHGQFEKIERRRAFLAGRADSLRALLSWPTPPSPCEPSIHEIYVSREVYWWMRNPPYAVSTEFIRIDALNSWFEAAKFPKA